MAKKQYRLTFDDVKKLFQEKDVELLSQESDFKNKKIYARDQFLMKARICNHEKTIRLNHFKQDITLDLCRQCAYQQRRVEYKNIVELFENFGCKLLISEQEYNHLNLNGKAAFNCIGHCGHKCKKSYFNLLKGDFINKNICRKCAEKSKGLKRSEYYKEKNLQLTKKICTEKNLQYISSLQEKRGGTTQHILKCQQNHQFKRTITELQRGQWCNICSSDVTQFSQQQNVSTGDYHEQCVFNLLKNHCKTIVIVGNTGNLYDIIYTLDDNIKRGLQVKSLTKNKYKDNVFGCPVTRGNGNCYPQNTIMILINQQQNRFLVDMSQNFSCKGVSINFSSKKSKYQNTKFTDQNLFLQRLISLLPRSAQIDNVILYSKSIQKEINCFERLQKKCVELGLSFQRNTTNGNSIDAYINDIPVQIKYCEKDQKYSNICFTLSKTGPMKNGKQTRISYSEKDQIKFFIFEYGGENGKYFFNFCILSKEFLIQKNYISTTNSKGKMGISVWKPDSEPGRDKTGTSKFWNKFDQLQ